MDEERRNKEIGPGSGMVSSGAGDIGTFKTQSEAQKPPRRTRRPEVTRAEADSERRFLAGRMG
ncbi:hypothetical protein ACGF3G_20945 [Streptomyces sp. NPDC048179]|uniref:hypothetical protein n=1 Tax=Streptomyces sp. NPDC048179 TaxID=3365506 RepID=UPI0037170D7A